MPTEKSALPSEFKIVADTVLVEDKRHYEPLSKPTYGVVADCPKHGRLLRWSRPGAAGPIHGYKRLFPDHPDRKPEDILPPSDECGAVLDRISGRDAGPRNRLNRLEPTPRERDFARFEAEYPGVAEALGIARKRLVSLFDAGECWHPQYDERVADPDWRSYVDLHASGDHGLFGRHVAEVSMTEGDIWTDPLDSRPNRNARAIKLLAGLVVSAYPIDRLPEPRHLPGMLSFVRNGDPTAPLVVKVQTVLGAGRPVTLCTIEERSSIGV